MSSPFFGKKRVKVAQNRVLKCISVKRQQKSSPKNVIEKFAGRNFNCGGRVDFDGSALLPISNRGTQNSDIYVFPVFTE